MRFKKQPKGERKEKLKSVLDDIFGDDSPSMSDDNEYEEILRPKSKKKSKVKFKSKHQKSKSEYTPKDIVIKLDKKSMSYENNSSFTLSIDEDIESFSMNLGFELSISPFMECHIGFDDERKTSGKKVNEMSFDINTYSLFENDKESEQNDTPKTIETNDKQKMEDIVIKEEIKEMEEEPEENKSDHQILYENYVIENGKPKTAKYLMTWAKQKGITINFGDARRVILKNKSLDIEELIKSKQKNSTKEDESESNAEEHDQEESTKQQKDSIEDEEELETLPVSPESQSKSIQDGMGDLVLSDQDQDNQSMDESEEESEDKPEKKALKDALSNLIPSDDDQPSDTPMDKSQDEDDEDSEEEEILNAEEDDSMDRKQQLKNALSSILGSDEDEEDDEESENDQNPVEIPMSQTLLSATPDPATTNTDNDEDAIINEDAEMVYDEQETLNKLPKSGATSPISPPTNNNNDYDGSHDRTPSELDKLRNMLSTLDDNDTSDDDENDEESTESDISRISRNDEDDILMRMKKRHSSSSNKSSDGVVYKPRLLIDEDKYNKRKNRKKKMNRSQSQPADVIMDLLDDMDVNNDMNKIKVPSLSSLSAKSKPTTPTKTLKKKQKTKKKKIDKISSSSGSDKKHQRSYSTDVHRKKPLKLQEWKSKYKNKKSSSNTINKKSFIALQQKGKTKGKVKGKKIHKMDFNLYDIEVKPNRRYRLIDGRIGIAKYKGKTAFGKGTETYIGILIEYGEGIHDGTVRGKTYFRCKDGKGDMVHPFQIIQDLGRYDLPITQEMIDNGDDLVQEAQLKLIEYEKKHNIKRKKQKK